MSDAAAAIQAALRELEEAREVLPDELAGEIDQLISRTKVLLASIQGQGATGTGAEEGPPSAEPS